MKQEKPACSTCGAIQFSLMRHVPGVELAQIDTAKMCNRYKKGQVLLFEGNKPMGVYCVNAGSFKMYKTTFDGKEQILGFSNPGDYVGYRALIADEPYNKTAEALEDSIACFIPKDAFLSLLESQPQLSKALLKSLCHDLGIAHERLVNMAQKSVRERLAETLLLLHDTFIPTHPAKSQQEQDVIAVQLPREDIANLTGSSTETIIRLLTEFKESGWIELNKKQIRIVNRQALQKTAKMG